MNRTKMLDTRTKTGDALISNILVLGSKYQIQKI